MSARDQGRLLLAPRGSISATIGVYGRRALAGEVSAPFSVAERSGGIHLYAEAERASGFYRGITPERAMVQLSADLELNEAWTFSGGGMLYRSRGDLQNPGWNRLTQALIDDQTYVTGRDTSVTDRNGDGKLTPGEVSPNRPYPFIDPLFIAYFGGPSAGSDAAHTLDVGVGSVRLDRRTVHVSDQDFSNTRTRTVYADLVRQGAGDGVFKLQLFFDDLSNRRFISYGFPAWYQARVGEARASHADGFAFGSITGNAVVGVSHRAYHGRRRESFNSGLIAYDRRDLSFGPTPNDIIDSPFDEAPGVVGMGWENDIQSRWRQTGAFTTADLTLPGKVNLVLGGRVDHYKVNSADSGALAYAPPAADGSESRATWNASLSWNSGGAVMPYIAIAETSALELSQAGDLSTGVIASHSWLSDGSLSEAGLKFQLLGGTLTGSLAGYRQGRTQLLSGPPPTVQGTRSRGGELELRYLASPRWSFTFSGASQRTRITGPDRSFTYIPAYVAGVAPQQAFGGAYVVYDFSSLPGRTGDYHYTLIPDGVASLYASYTSRPFASGRAGFTGGITHASQTAGTVQDAVRYPAYSLINVSTFLEHGAWTALLNIDNLTDALYFTPDADVYANLGAVPGRGREWRLSVKRSF